MKRYIVVLFLFAVSVGTSQDCQKEKQEIKSLKKSVKLLEEENKQMQKELFALMEELDQLRSLLVENDSTSQH